MNYSQSRGTRVPEQHRSPPVELGRHPSFCTTNIEYVHDVYRSVAGDSEIEEYLATTEYFDTAAKQWAIPTEHTAEGNLVSSFCGILRSIVQRFVHPVQPGVQRTVINMHNAPGNIEKSNDGYVPCPNLVVQASGPSFEDPIVQNDTVKCGPNVAFCNVASYCAIKMGSEVGTPKENVREMESYARYVRFGRLLYRRLTFVQRDLRPAAQPDIHPIPRPNGEVCSPRPLRPCWRRGDAPI